MQIQMFRKLLRSKCRVCAEQFALESVCDPQSSLIGNIENRAIASVSVAAASEFSPSFASICGDICISSIPRVMHLEKLLLESTCDLQGSISGHLEDRASITVHPVYSVALHRVTVHTWLRFAETSACLLVLKCIAHSKIAFLKCIAHSKIALVYCTLKNCILPATIRVRTHIHTVF